MAIENVNVVEPAGGTPIAVDDVAGDKFQAIKLALGADGQFDLVLDSGQQLMVNSLPVVIASDQGSIPVNLSASLPSGSANIGSIDINTQLGLLSPSNSSTAILGAGGTFNGTGQSTLGYAAITVFVAADQDGALYIDQSQNGTDWDVSDPYTLTGGTPLLQPVQLDGEWVRVRYVNGSTIQGYFRLESILRPIHPILPRTLTQEGNLKVAIVEPSIVAYSPQFSVGTDTGVAATTSTDLDSDQISVGKTAHLMEIVVAADETFKAELKTVQNGIASSNKVVWVEANKAWHWKAPGRGFITQAYDAGAGLDGFRLTITNLHASDSADVFCSFFWDEV